MIARIRALMNTPFAKPPGKRGLWARFAPEWCAGLIYLTALAIIVIRGGRLVNVEHHSIGQTCGEVFQLAAGVGYGIFGVCITLFPLIAAAMTWASERKRDTLEGLVLTPLDGRRIALGRWLRVVTPWLRLFLYMLPFYLLLSLSGGINSLVRHAHGLLTWEEASGLVGCAFVTKGIVTIGVTAASHWEHMTWSPGASAVIVARLINDLVVFFFLTGGAYLCSLWFRTSGRALAAAFLLVLGALCTVMSADIWGFVAGGLLHEFHAMPRLSWEFLFGYYTLAAGPCMLLKLGLGALMVRLAVTRFNAWAVREKPER